MTHKYNPLIGVPPGYISTATSIKCASMPNTAAERVRQRAIYAGLTMFISDEWRDHGIIRSLCVLVKRPPG